MAATRHQFTRRILGGTVYTTITTFSTGAPTAPTSTPTGSVYTDANLAGQSTAMSATVTVTALTGKTGMYQVSWPATSGTGHAVGMTVHCILTYAISGTTYYHEVELHVE